MQQHRHRRQFVLISYWIYVTIYQVTKFINDRKHGRNLDDLHPMSVMPFTPQLKKNGATSSPRKECVIAQFIIEVSAP